MSRRGTSDLEERAMELAHDAATFGVPDAGISGQITEVVRTAYKRGYENAAAELADAYSLYLIEDDDLDAFRDALTERIPEGWKVPKGRTALARQVVDTTTSSTETEEN